MYHFFVTKEQVIRPHIFVQGSDVNHMKNVLRLKPGTKVEITDGEENTYFCQIQDMGKEEICLEILESGETQTELPCKISLFQGLPKSDKMELIIQKAVELGASEIIPVKTVRTIVKWDEKKAEKKVQRWNSISESAAKQSGRGRIPVVNTPLSFFEAIDRLNHMDVFLMPYENERDMDYTREVLKKLKLGMEIGILIGPEGGFTREEVELAKKEGAKVISLGKRILRTETAGLALLSVLSFLLEE